MVKHLVIAGRQWQAEEWAAKNKIPRKEYTYVNHEDQLRGLQGIPVVKVGNWETNPVAQSEGLRFYQQCFEKR